MNDINLLGCYRSFVENNKKEFGILEGNSGERLQSELKKCFGRHSTFVSSFFEIADGQKLGSPPLFLNEFWLIDLSASIETTSIFLPDSYDVSYDDKRIQPKSWSKSWCCFAMDGFGEMLIFDMEPPESGNFGQIVKIWHDDNIVRWISNDICDLISNV